MVVEDDLTSRRILTAILKKWGYDPVAAEDSAAAWEALQQPGAPELILLDRKMEGLDGLEVCRRLRANDASSSAYIILLTGLGEKSDIVQGLEAGANDYISKPYDNEELRARIKVGQRMLELQSSLRQARDALAHQAMHDPLTGVFNRRAILARLSKELSRARREDGRLSVGMCDLDHFKKINDTLGHQAGDEVLVAFTRCIQAHLRDYDSIGRYGGDEFLVIAIGARGQAFESLYERLRARVAATEIVTNTGNVSLTISIGVAQRTDQSTAEALIAAADAALYRAKAEGRNRVAHAIQDLSQSPGG
jgi:two-component system cell cycle response regulator